MSKEKEVFRGVNMKHYWETKDGIEIDISKMETSHIKNAIAMLERTAKKGVEVATSYGYNGDDDFMTGDVEVLEGRDFLNRTQYKHLMSELKKREA